MPVGLRELALRQKLSAQFIHAVVDRAENLLDQEEDDGSIYIERLLALTLLRYLLYSKGTR
jgi:hypothetical protein